jgi:RND family efflux transporter MFP subunit
MTARFAHLMFVAVVALAGCKGKTDGKAAMPPATGQGAAPMPELPKVVEAPGSKAGSASTSEGHATGTLFAHAEAQLAPTVGGTIAEIMVKESDRVKAGDVVFRLDTRDASLRREQARVAVNAAKVNLSAIEVELKRTQSLFDQNAANKAQLEQMQARYDGAKVQVEQAEVMLQIANKSIGDATVRSPINGVVTMKLKNVGEMATMMPPTIVLVIQDHATLDLKFRLPERALATVKPGTTFTANFAAVGAKRDAKVTRINPTIDARTRTLEVIAEVANPDLTLMPGLLAEIEMHKAGENK